jgi:hypothetical protein
MSKIIVFGQLSSSALKVKFLKSCIYSLIQLFNQSVKAPQELSGFILHFELNVKKIDLQAYSDDELSSWLAQQVHHISEREHLYATWFNLTPAHQRLSFLLDRLRARLFLGQIDAMLQIESSLQEVSTQFIEQLEKDRVCELVEEAMTAYQLYCWWPISQLRRQQQSDLRMALLSANNANDAIKILRKHIQYIRNHHLSNSFCANYLFFNHESRLVVHLHAALTKIACEMKINSNNYSPVSLLVEKAIDEYLHEDWFYHNRSRRKLAYQLLAQLQADELRFTSEEIIQRKYKLRSTLDEYIASIDHDFYHTHFFSPFYTIKRSRLSLKLVEIKKQLIESDHLSALELNLDIKQPIVSHLQELLQGMDLPKQMQSDIVTLINAVHLAHTPHAIEAAIEAHINSYLQERDLLTCLKYLLPGQVDHYFVFAIKLEHALLDWQMKGILPAASGYQTFLMTLAANREKNENQIQRIEQQCGIKFPRHLDGMRKINAATQKKALALLNRITAV